MEGAPPLAPGDSWRAGGGEGDQTASGLPVLFRLYGPIIHGDKQGREVGCPTANLLPWEQYDSGVYAGTARFNGEDYEAMVWIGRKSKNVTGNDRRVLAESHIFDFDEDIYGEPLEVTCHKHMRPDNLVPRDMDHLKEIIENDKVSVLEYFQKSKS